MNPYPLPPPLMLFDDNDGDDTKQPEPNEDIPGKQHPPHELEIPGETEGVDNNQL